MNYAWEILQAPLYHNSGFSEIQTWLVCLRAGFGDVVIVLGIYALGGLLFRSFKWPAHLTVSKGVYLGVVGVALAVLIEVMALRSGKWSYNSVMPLLPIAGVGVTPVAQLMILPWLSMQIFLRILREEAVPAPDESRRDRSRASQGAMRA